jgi:predicted Zn-dependent peptidase
MKHTVFEHHLSGGAAGLVIDVPGSDVVSLQVRFNSGFQFADQNVYEVPHVMEHVVANVTKKHSQPNQFIVQVQKNGAYSNAFTSVDSNGYVYECADFELDRILDLVEEQLTQPLLTREPLDIERGNVREELSRNTTQHATVCAVALAEKTFPGMWLNYDTRIEQLPNITAKDLQQHFGKTHTASNARFVIAGSFPDHGDKVSKRLDKLFSGLEKGERLTRSGAIGQGLVTPVVSKRDIQQIYYRLGMYFGELTEPERRALTILRTVLVGGMGSRIYGEARKRGLAYAVSGVGHAEPGNSSFGFLGYVTPGNALKLFELMAHEFSSVANGDLKKAELDASKDLLVGSIKRSVQTAGDILGWYIDPYDESGDVRDFQQHLDYLRDVKREEVVAVAKKAAIANRRGLSFLGPVTRELAKTYAYELAPVWDGVTRPELSSRT